MKVGVLRELMVVEAASWLLFILKIYMTVHVDVVCRISGTFDGRRNEMRKRSYWPWIGQALGR